MTEQEALEILSNHQKWRLGDDEVEATNPKELTKAIEVAFISLGDSLEDKYRWRKVSEELPQVNEEHYRILTKSDDNRLDVVSIFNGYDKDVVKFLLKNYIEWKPID